MTRKPGACTQNDDKLRQWTQEGLTLQEMAARIGTTRHRVKEYLDKHNIPWAPVARKGERNGRWKGGRIVDQDGYVLIKHHDHPRRDRHNYVREHRLVMEQVLGRYLQPQEVVHHKDGNKQNNDPANLEVFGTNADHLAETLRGQRPQWTPKGWAKMKAPKGQPQGRLHTSIRARSSPGVETSQ
jgi:HNH endonuclease